MYKHTKLAKNFMLLSLFAGLIFCCGCKQTYTRVPGTRVSLILPPNYTSAKSFTGFENNVNGLTIKAVEVPGNITAKEYFHIPGAFRQPIINDKDKEEVTIDGYKGTLIDVNLHQSFGIERKWVAIFGDGKETVIISTTFSSDNEETKKRLKETLLNAKWERNAKIDLSANLPFHLEETSSLKIVRRTGETLYFTKNGASLPQSPSETLLIAGYALYEFNPKDKRQFCIDRLTYMRHFGLKVESIIPITIDGLGGFECIASATTRDSNAPIVIYYLVLFEEKTYFSLQATASFSDRNRFLEQFRFVARSFKRK